LSATNRAFWTVLLCACLAVAAPAAMPVSSSAVVSVAEGAPFSLIRGTVKYAAVRAVDLVPGDLIESSSNSLLILEFRSGSAVGAVVGIGPSTRAYWMEHPHDVVLAMLSGWIKVDSTSSAPSASLKVQGTRLGAATNNGSYIVHAGESADEIFHESGTMTLWIQKPDGTGVGRESRPNEFASRTGAGEVHAQPRLSTDFTSAMPPAFRDPLPAGLAAQLRGKAEPKFVRDVAYEDVSDWLGSPKEWRKDFPSRFLSRLKDPVFLHALEIHLSVHPEWDHLVHPPPAAKSVEARGTADPTLARGTRGDLRPNTAEVVEPTFSPEIPPKTAPSRPPDAGRHQPDWPAPVAKHVLPIKPLPESEASMDSCPYPAEALRQELTGSVGLLVYVSASGDVLNTRVDESSGSDALDQAALNCVREKGHFPLSRRGNAERGYWGHMRFNWSFGR
jgi:TonB family protein